MPLPRFASTHTADLRRASGSTQYGSGSRHSIVGNMPTCHVLRVNRNESLATPAASLIWLIPVTLSNQHQSSTVCQFGADQQVCGWCDNLLSGTKYRENIMVMSSQQRQEKRRKEKKKERKEKEDIGCKVNPRRMKYMRIGTDV